MTNSEVSAPPASEAGLTCCVEYAQVTKSYTDQVVLQQVTLQIPQGKTTAIVGASGSGKTTLLQLANGMVRPDAGSVRVFGEAVPNQQLAKFRRRIGYSVQGAGLFPHLTNAQNIVLLAKLEGWSEQRIQQRLQSLLADMELEETVCSRYPIELSGGQQQRVGLCRALMLAPQLLLLDEPFSAVDPITRVGIYQAFERVQRAQQVSTMLVTHDMREAVRLADYLVVLKDGRVLRNDLTAAVLSDPGDPYVISLMSDQL